MYPLSIAGIALCDFVGEWIGDVCALYFTNQLYDEKDEKFSKNVNDNLLDFLHLIVDSQPATYSLSNDL